MKKNNSKIKHGQELASSNFHAVFNFILKGNTSTHLFNKKDIAKV